MTRFARAKGSKSCNDKTPEEATSWLEMKNAIISKPSSPVNVAGEVVKKQKEKGKKIKAEWASLDNDTVEDYFSLIREHHNTERNNPNEKKKKENKKTNSANKESDSLIRTNESGKQVAKKKNLVSDAESGKVNLLPEESNVSKKAKKKGEKRKLNELINGSEGPSKKIKVEKCISVKKELNQKNLKKVKGDSSKGVKTGEVENRKNKAKKLENKGSKKIKNTFNSKQTGNQLNTLSGKYIGSNNHNKNEKKKKKDFNGRREKFNELYNKQNVVEELIVNGEKIQIVKFQGFNVTLKDAEKLKKLRAEMFKEGIPKAKLEAALKLERRRAEKALSRLKKAVCFHCRKSGHVLSQCPSLTESQNTGTGICYKCGSTEHLAVECKVVRGSSFQFAECFICKEQGHIARQCPDNPRGLYPNGGACRECGDVTHLKRDCPKVVSKKEGEQMTVGIRNDRNLELLDEEIVTRKTEKTKKYATKKSVVKF